MEFLSSRYFFRLAAEARGKDKRIWKGIRCERRATDDLFSARAKKKKKETEREREREREREKRKRKTLGERFEIRGRFEVARYRGPNPIRASLAP